MDESPDQIEDHIRATRRELGDHLRELENKVKHATDWRVQFARHPGLFLGAALAGGLLLSASLGARTRRHGSRDLPAAHPLQQRAHAASFQVWANIKEGLAAAAGSQIGRLLSELIPGFREHHE